MATGDRPLGNVLRAAMRVRPRLRRDATNGTDTIATEQCRVVVGGNDAFTFSQAFGPEATQRAVYNYCAAPQVAAVLEGLDACVFAFGKGQKEGPHGRCHQGRAKHVGRVRAETSAARYHGRCTPECAEQCC